MLFCILVAALMGNALSSLPCMVGGKIPGTWNGHLRKENLGEKSKAGEYWSLNCKTDTSNWIQLVQRTDAKSVKVLHTFQAADFSCQVSDYSSMCDLVTNIVVYPGKPPLTVTAHKNQYQCREDGDPVNGFCLQNHPLFVPETDLNLAANTETAKLITWYKKGWGKAPKSILKALPQERIHVELSDEGFTDSLMNSAQEFLKVEPAGIRKKNLQWFDVFVKDLDGDGKPETIKQVILNPGLDPTGSKPEPKVYIISLSSKGRESVSQELLFKSQHCETLKKGGTSFQFIPNPKLKKAYMLEFKIEEIDNCTLPVKMQVRCDTLKWDSGIKSFVQNRGLFKSVELK